MPKIKLHIVSFDIPFPADYGGAIDVFYKVKALYEAGCEIYLHCYEYGRRHQDVLKQYCKEVWYYPRATGLKGISLSLPYIVSSRRDEQLLRRLQDIDAPILFEGVHTTYFLAHPLLQQRFKGIRTHNVEADYYAALSKKEASFTAKTYYKIESSLLRNYERNLEAAQAFLSLSLADRDHFTELYPDRQCIFLPPFHSNDKVESLEGSGNFCLYHGNLSHPENREAVMFLLKEVIPFSAMRFVVAGRKPDSNIVAACNALPNCTLVADPGDAEMQSLIRDAHIHVLPTFQASGMKLKLLSSLFGGRHVLVNREMLHGTGLESACHIVSTGKEFVDTISALSDKPFTIQDIALRKAALAVYGNAVNARMLLGIIGNK